MPYTTPMQALEHDDAHDIGVTPRSLAQRMWQARSAYVFIAPFFLLLTVFMLFPILLSLGISFHRWNGIMEPRFVGIDNYVRAATDIQLHRALLNTGLFTVITVVVGTAVSLALALFLNQARFLKNFYRAVFFVPSIVSLVVVSIVWRLMLNSELGLMHELLMALGRFLAPLTLDGTPPAWTTEKYRLIQSGGGIVSLVTMAFVNLWAIVGFNTVIYLAGLQSVPTELYEAGRMDGATPYQTFRNITVPMLVPTTLFVVLMTTIDSLQVFVLPAIMNRDGESTMTVVYYLYRNAFEFYRMGYASAIAYLLLAITVVVSLLMRRRLRGHDSVV